MENKLKYLSNSYSKSGTSFKDTSLEAVLKHCLMLPKNGKKGQYGSIFVYDSDRLGEHLNDEKSTGIILLDIDNISKDVAKIIYDQFDVLIEQWTSLLAIQFSSSYYIDDKKNGLHIYVKSKNLDKFDYKIQSQVCLSIFSQIVYKTLGIDLLSLGTEEKPVLDLHNTNLYQRFNLFYSTFKYNENATIFSMDDISFEDFEKLCIKYNIELDKKITKTINPSLSNVLINTIDKKIKVDRNLHIGKYSGNDIRYRISIIADKLFGDNAKDFCDKFFYYENNKSIYTHYSSGNIINPLIYKWLVENKFIIEHSQNLIENWIDEYSEVIMSEIIKNNQIEFIAPTGSGKTTFINNFLAHRFNSVVIVPFNVTNRLYDNLIEVNANYAKKVPENKPVVMVWDQAIKHWEEIKNRHIIIDEAHTLFFDRTYRDSAIKLMMKIKEENVHATFITATPAGESEYLNMKQIKFYKNRNVITLNIKASKNIEWAQYNFIKKCIDNNWYDKIVLLDDISAKKIYEKFIIEGYGEEICYIRSNTKDTKDFIDLRETELLRKKINICTCVAFNGLNFKNENEKILVVGSIQLGMTTSSIIIQQIGRIRNSEVNALYFYNPEKYYIEDIDNKEIKAQEFNNLVANGVPDTFLSYDRKYLNVNYVEALRNIQEYILKHSNIDTIIYELGLTGYLNGVVEDKLNDNNVYTMNLAIKRKESDIMKQDILNGDFLYKDYDSEYSSKWAKDIRYMISNSMYSGITLESIEDMVRKGTKKKLIETYITNIKNIIRYVQVDEDEYQRTINNMNMYANMLSNQIDRKQFITNINNIKKIRNKYIDKIQFNNDSIILTDIIQDVIAMEEENQLKIKEAGKKGTKQIKDTLTGIVYDSCVDCAKHIGKSNAYITKYKDRFVYIK